MIRQQVQRADRLALLVLWSCLSGCLGPDPAREPHGKVFFVEGAGGWGFGEAGVRAGLREAGYRGDIEVFRWSASFNPLLDQLDLLGAGRRAGDILAARIRDYKRRHPHASVHLVALSAGTGIAVWACERLDHTTAVDNVILLGSSLSHDYNVIPALHRIRGRIYVYHSNADAVLATVPLIGTIDGRVARAAAGQVGLQVPARYAGKVFNTPWSRHWSGFGWNGGHTDCAGRQFVREEIARRIVPRARLAGAAAR